MVIDDLIKFFNFWYLFEVLCCEGKCVVCSK